MARIYTRKGSPYYWLRFKNAQGKLEQVSTRCRIIVAPEARRARQMALEKSIEELKYADQVKNETWGWVGQFFSVRYQAKPATLERYKSAWPTIKLFLDEQKIQSPAHLLRHHCFAYMDWRQQPEPKKGKYKACHNTALLELRILRVVMQEAVERELCTGNPCVRLKINKQKGRLKPEVTEAQCDEIRAAIQKVADPVEREMLANSFEIGRYQGCRLKETRLDPFTAVDLNDGTVVFDAKRSKEFGTMLHPKLVPLFTRLRAEGKRSTWDPPKDAGRQWASAKWFKFLEDNGFKKSISPTVCFHSLRVTTITRMARAGVSISKAKSYVGHASTTMNFIYQRLRPDDLNDCAAALD